MAHAKAKLIKLQEAVSLAIDLINKAHKECKEVDARHFYKNSINARDFFNEKCSAFTHQ